MEEDFKVIIDSLGMHAVEWIPNVNYVRIDASNAEGTATLQVCMKDHSWQAREVAIDKLVELRGMFMDDLSLDYCFVADADDDAGCTAPTQGARVYQPA